MHIAVVDYVRSVYELVNLLLYPLKPASAFELDISGWTTRRLLELLLLLL